MRSHIVHVGPAPTPPATIVGTHSPLALPAVSAHLGPENPATRCAEAARLHGSATTDPAGAGVDTLDTLPELEACWGCGSALVPAGVGAMCWGCVALEDPCPVCHEPGWAGEVCTCCHLAGEDAQRADDHAGYRVAVWG